MDEEQKCLLVVLVFDLVRKRYEDLVVSHRNGSLSKEDIKRAVIEYPGTLTMPPPEWFEQVWYYPRIGHEDQVGSAEIDLWVDNKRSDLTLQVDFKKKNSKWMVTIDDIHVM